MLHIQQYDAKIKYVPEKDMPIVDALSRSSSGRGEAAQGLDVSEHDIHLHLNSGPTRVPDKDNTALREVIMHGWLEKRSDCPPYRWPDPEGHTYCHP